MKGLMYKLREQYSHAHSMTNLPTLENSACVRLYATVMAFRDINSSNKLVLFFSLMTKLTYYEHSKILVLVSEHILCVKLNMVSIV